MIKPFFAYKDCNDKNTIFVIASIVFAYNRPFLLAIGFTFCNYSCTIGLKNV